MALNTKTTQQFIPIKDTRDGVTILKNGSLRVVLMISSINFALKGDDEQTALLLQFQNFLHSLDFSIQIVVQSKKLNIAPYLETIGKRVELQPNELLKIQTREYVQFIESLTSTINIMSKNFFIIIPYTTTIVATPKKNFLQSVFSKEKRDVLKDERFEEYKIQLEQRTLMVEQGLSSMGLRSVRLDTPELIELYYKAFNPGETQKPPVGNTKYGSASV